MDCDIKVPETVVVINSPYSSSFWVFLPFHLVWLKYAFLFVVILQFHFCVHNRTFQFFFYRFFLCFICFLFFFFLFCRLFVSLFVRWLVRRRCVCRQTAHLWETLWFVCRYSNDPLGERRGGGGCEGGWRSVPVSVFNLFDALYPECTWHRRVKAITECF